MLLMALEMDWLDHPGSLQREHLGKPQQLVTRYDFTPRQARHDDVLTELHAALSALSYPIQSQTSRS